MPAEGFTIHVVPADFDYHLFVDGAVGLDELAVGEDPIAALDDVRWYWWDEHAIYFTNDARERLEAQEVGQVFLVSVYGERVYGGVLWSASSSLVAPGMEMMIDPPGFDDAPMWIHHNDGLGHLDLRGDPRIREVFESAGKLR